MTLLRAVSLSVILACLSGCGDKPAPTKPAAPVAKPVAAAPADPAAAELAAIQKVLVTKHPDLASAPHKISKVPGADLYEVVTGTGVAYTDKTGDWFVSGVLYFGDGHAPDGQPGIIPYTRRPAMQMLISSLGGATPAADPAAPDAKQMESILSGDMSGRQMFDALPLSAGFSTRLGAGTQKLVVFEDPDCPFCQAFHQEIAAAQRAGTLGSLDVELITFPYVLSDRHPNALARARAIACASNPSAAWSKWMQAAAMAPKGANGAKDMDQLWSVWAPLNAPGTGDCSRAALVDAWQAAGRQMQFMATPTYLFSDGTTFEGQLSLSDLGEMLAVAAKNRGAQPANAGGPLASGSQVSSQAAAALRDLTEATLEEGDKPADPAPPKP